jgi:hypothetical protein
MIFVIIGKLGAMTRFLTTSFLIFVVVSCSKEDLTSAAPSLIGNWVHYRSAEEAEIIEINADGTGKVSWYDGVSLQRETKVKTWKIDGNRMSLGNVTFNLSPYDIDEYPTISSTTVIEGFDTLEQGLRYMKLDGLFYTEIE